MGFIFMKPKARCHKVRKSAESQAALDRLNSFLEGALDEPVRFLVRFWGDQRTVITYAELRRIITAEDVPQDIMDDWFHDYSTLLSERITPMWRDAMITGYRSNPAFEGTGFQFNSSEENVRRWMADRSAELVTNCCREQQEAIRYLVAESVIHQMTPAELARYIRPTIGLTERQAAANLKYYENMKLQLSENHPRMKPENIENRAREAAARYAERQQRYRAETIARTELVTAYHQGNDEAVRQAMEQNLMPPMKKIWSTSGDDKVCPACSALEGMEIGMDDGFKFTSGRRTMEVELPPAHPRCACAVMYVEEKQQEASEEQRTDNFESYQEEQIHPNFYDTSPEGENVANGDESGIIKEIRIPESAYEIPGITEDILDEIQSGINAIRREYELKLDDIFVEDMRDTRPNTPYCCKYIDDYGKHKAVFIINSGFDFSDIQYIVKEGYAQGYFAGKTLEDHIIHEMAHIMTGQECNTASEFMDFLSEVERKFVPGVSGYSDMAKDGFETIAEAFVKVRNGEFDEARKLVEKYVMRWKK